MTPRVSICIPAYRQPAMLRRLLASIAEQDFTEFETIVTDDSPDDQLQTVVAEFTDRFPIRYERNAPPLGSPGNWNRAIELATAPYIKVIHHDDWFTGPGSLRALVDMLDDHPQAVIAFGGSTHCNPAGQVYGHHRATPEQVDAVRRIPAALFGLNVIGAPSAVIFRRTSIRFDPSLKWLVDIDFYIRLLTDNGGAAERIAWTTDELVCVMGDSPDRVTADCVTDPRVLAFEGIYVYDRLVQEGLAGPAERAVILSTLRNLGDPSAEQLIGYGVPADSAESLSRAARQGRHVRALRRQLGAIRQRFRSRSDAEQP